MGTPNSVVEKRLHAHKKYIMINNTLIMDANNMEAKELLDQADWKAFEEKLGVTACQPIPWLGGDNRIPEDQHLWGGAAWPSGFAISQGTPT